MVSAWIFSKNFSAINGLIALDCVGICRTSLENSYLPKINQFNYFNALYKKLK